MTEKENITVDLENSPELKEAVEETIRIDKARAIKALGDVDSAIIWRDEHTRISKEQEKTGKINMCVNAIQTIAIVVIALLVAFK